MSMARLRAAWVTQAAVGWAVAARMRTRRVACSMTAWTYGLAPVSVEVSKKVGCDDGVGLGAQERCPGVGGWLGWRGRCWRR
jgi:hypothetical protein